MSGAPDLETAGRIAAYRAAAALLCAPPTAEILAQISTALPAAPATNPPPAADDFAAACARLRAACQNVDLADAGADYARLFVGMGGGGAVSPFASWHRTGFLMEKPLADLRHDLQALGIERRDQVVEPEDHAGALCETMAIVAADHGFARQRDFFARHLASWIESFFAQMEAAAQTELYRAAARFGARFAALEARCFEMPS